MNDLLTIWEAPEAPSPEARRRARAALLERAARRRRPVLRASFAALALALSAGVVVVENLGTPGHSIPSASARVLERAAHAAERRPFTAPRDDEWIYTEDRSGTYVIERWRRADGLGSARRDGRTGLLVEMERPGRAPLPFDSYARLAALPTAPDALLRVVYREGEHITGAGSTREAEAYGILGGMLAAGVLPPDSEAALFRTIERIPGVTVSTVEVLGEPTLSLALTDDWLRQELLLDPRTYAYRGKRSTTIKEPPPEKGKGLGTVVAERVAVGIVAKPGERP
jgi:hypothetical protein